MNNQLFIFLVIFIFQKQGHAFPFLKAQIALLFSIDLGTFLFVAAKKKIGTSVSILIIRLLHIR